MRATCNHKNDAVHFAGKTGNFFFFLFLLSEVEFCKQYTVVQNSLLLHKTNNSLYKKDLRTIFVLFTNLRIAFKIKFRKPN